MPFRGEAQNCETVKFLLVSPTYERGLKLSLIKSPSGVGRTRNVVTKSIFTAKNRTGTVVSKNFEKMKILHSKQ